VRKLRKRILIALGITVATLLILYFGRRLFFESMIIGKAESTLEAALGVDVSIGAVSGNWLTEIVVEDVDIRGGEGSAYREITDLDIEFAYSAFALISGDLRGLEHLRVRCKRMVLDTKKAWVGRDEEPETEPSSTSLDDVLAMFGGGASIEIDELVLLPDYVAAGGATITVNPGQGKRTMSVVTGETRLEGDIDGSGNFDAKIVGNESGRALRALGLGTEIEGKLEGHVRGNTKTANIEFDLDVTTRRGDADVAAQCKARLEGGILTAPRVHLDLPGISIDGGNLQFPIAELSTEKIAAILEKQKNGSLEIKITDLEPYKDLLARLPASVQELVPIKVDFRGALDKGVIALRPSVFTGKGYELRITKGSLSFAGSIKAPITLDQLRSSTATELEIELDVPRPLAIDIPGSGPLVLAGRVTATVSGSLGNPDAKASIDLRDIRFGEFDVDTLSGRIVFDGKRMTLTDAKVRGAGRRTDSFRFAIDGGGALHLPSTDGELPRVTLDLRGDIPREVLCLANAPKDFVDKLTLSPASITADVRLQKGSSALPIGSVSLAMPRIAIQGLDPIDLKCKVALAARGVVQIENLSLHSETATVRARGTIGLDDKLLDLTVDGKLNQLLPICRLLKLRHDLDGSLEIDKITAKGSMSTLPDMTVSARARLSSISPLWFASARHDVPEVPLEVTVVGSSSGAGFDVTKLQLGWGKANRRIDLEGSGPLPLKFANGKIQATKRGRPFAIELHASDDRPRPKLKIGKVEVDGKIEIDAFEVRVPNLGTRSVDGSFEVRGLRAGIELSKILDKSIKWPDVAIAGEVQMREFWIGHLIGELIPKPEKKGVKPTEVRGAASGNLTVTGRIGQPSVTGLITLKRGGVAYPGAPVVEAIEGTARFDATSIELKYDARTTDQTPLTILASLNTGSLPLWTAFSKEKENTALTGKLRIEGLDLALLKGSFGEVVGLHGKVVIDGSLVGTRKRLQPDILITVREAGWQLPDSEEKIEGLSATAHLTRSEVTITEFRGRVPGLNLNVSVSGGFKVEKDAALWEYVTDKSPTGNGTLEFSDIPLELLPRKNGLEVAAGIASGKLTLTGTFASLRPTFTASIRKGALKLESFPRIEDLTVQLVANQEGATFEGTATMGAGPLKIEAKLTPSKNTKVLDAFAQGKIEATVKGSRMLLVRTGGLKLRGDVDLRAKGTFEKIDIGGVVTLDDSKYVKRLSLVPDLKVTSAASTGDTFGPWAITGGERLVFDVALKTKDPIELRTNVIDTDLDLNCRLQGQGNALSLKGTCTSRTGTIRFPGMSMRITTMRLAFKGGAQPNILVVASGQRHGIRINMRLDGPIHDAVPKLSSSPALQPRDLWSLVTTGARPEALTANSAASNTAILATYVIQELVLTYLASESTEASQSFVSRFTFEFGRELSRDGAETWEINFDIGELWYVPERFGLRFERDVYEDYNLGLVYRWRF